MTHYLKKYDADLWPNVDRYWNQISELWPNVGNDFTSFIQAAINKYYWLKPNSSAQSWEWADSDNGSDITFYCPETVNVNDLQIGSFYYLHARTDLVNPICAFELHDVITEFVPGNNSPYVYKCIGKTWRSILDEGGILVDLSLSKASFKTVCKKLLEAIVDGHNAFSSDDSLIVDDDFIFPSYRARTYAIEVIKDLESYGYKIWFDSLLRMNAVKNEVDSRSYTINALLSSYQATLNTTDLIRKNDRFEIGSIIYRITDISGNNITVDKKLSISPPYVINVTSSYIVDLDWDQKITSKEISLQKNERPASRFWINAENVVSTVDKTDSFTATGAIADSIYSLTQRPSTPNRIFVAFDKQSELDDNFNFAPIGSGADTVRQGRLVVNNLALGTYSNHYRDYNTSLDSSGGLAVGGSLVVNQTTGKIALFGIKSAPSDTPITWFGGFLVDGNTLKVIYQGVEYSTSFASIVPTVERTISGISIAGTNTIISVDNNDLAYQIGSTVTVQLNGETKNFGTVTARTGSTVTINRNITFISGMTLLQQADYLMKVSYFNGSMKWYAKRGTDLKFTLLREENVKLPNSSFVSIYANQLQAASFDYIDIQENLAIQIQRVNLDGSIRNLDVAFEESASFLQGEVEVYEDDDEVWKVKFAAIEESEIYLIQTVISPSELVLLSVANLSTGTRLLVNNYARTILSVNTGARSVTLSSAVSGLTTSSPVYRTDTIPGNGETLQVIYKPVENVSIALCGTSCAIPANKATKLIKIDTQQSINYDTFRQIAQDEVNSACLPEVTGSFEFIIESYKKSERALTGILDDIPFAGQRIRLKTRGQYNSLYNDLEAVINEVRLSSTGHENAFRCSVSFGSTKYEFETFITNLKRAAVGQSSLIRDDLPEDDLICSITETMTQSDYQATISNATRYAFRSGLYRGGYISGVT